MQTGVAQIRAAAREPSGAPGQEDRLRSGCCPRRQQQFLAAAGGLDLDGFFFAAQQHLAMKRLERERKVASRMVLYCIEGSFSFNSLKLRGEHIYIPQQPHF